MSHAPKRADRLLIRPASGRQAGTGLFARTNHWKDTRQTRGHPYAESQTKSTGTTLTRAPDGTPNRVTGLTPEQRKNSKGKRDQKNSPSRLRFRPPNQLTFRLRVRPLSSASTYSRSVLDAVRNLDA